MFACHEFTRACGLKLILVSLMILGTLSSAVAWKSDQAFTIYLVRHAEKDVIPADPENPGLSECGESRAASLARILVDAKLEKIYSTDYERTLATARPSAEALSLETEIYDPGDLEAVSRSLLSSRQNALVVGHSNTTGVLAGLLAGETLEPFDEHIYDRLYQVTLFGSDVRITLLHQGFICEN
jgi:broad specificity phosphatase PhoE